MGMEVLFEKHPAVKKIEQLGENIILVERIDGAILLIRRRYPCVHKGARHLQYHVTRKDEVDNIYKLEKRLDWLEYGFWVCSGIWDDNDGLRNLIVRFLNYRCPGALHFPF